MASAVTSRNHARSVALLLARAAGGLIVAWLLLSGLLLAARSLASATRPLDPGQLLAAAVGLGGAACAARAISSLGGNRPGMTWRRKIPPAAVSLAVLLWGVALTRRAESPAAVALFWSFLVAEEGWALWRTAFGGRKKRPLPFGTPAAEREDLVLQQFTRLLAAEEEIVRGSLSVLVDRGSRVAAGHVAFCPPFVERPHFEVQPGAESWPPGSAANATLKVTQLYPHGARIEVRLPQPAAAETTVPVRFVARAPRSVASRSAAGAGLA
ncbi:MAG TPA: hypothetical protein VG125_12020 [Pirellulales bacterium]|jgi:hypothetical protein|nr:hypothetical protein [Pirellulales bacterium]